MSENQAVEVFFSYSHRDEALRDELAKHLSIMKRQKLISAWHDRLITAGSEWAGDIDSHLDSAKVILLLISADFLASDYCYDIELKRAMERHDAGEACVIPIILKPVDWYGAPFGKLQALPKNAQPITTWANMDEAFFNVTQGIRKAIGAMTQVEPNIPDTKLLSEHPPASITAAVLSSQPLSRGGLTSRQRSRLEEELNSLQKEHDLLSWKLKNLRLSRKIETDTAVKLKLDVQIEETTTEMLQVEQRLDEIESQLNQTN